VKSLHLILRGILSDGVDLMSKQVFFSDRAFVSILAETKERVHTETGGILLGHREGDAWYVIESIDPGPASIFTPSYFEYDHPYVNHLANKVAKLYQAKIKVLGLWHRHPGSMDCFSSTDDQTNRDFAEKFNGVLSGIVNLDPEFRLTMYYLDENLNAEEVGYEVGDFLIPHIYLEQRKSEELRSSLVLGSSLKNTQALESHSNDASLPAETEGRPELNSKPGEKKMLDKSKKDEKKGKLVDSFLEVLSRDLEWLDSNKLITHEIKMLDSSFVLEVFRQVNLGHNDKNTFSFYADSLNNWAVLYDEGFINYYEGFIKTYLSNKF
jgi:proteasome lid subunit RPN8/RPN11